MDLTGGSKMFSDNENPGAELSAGQDTTAATAAPEQTTNVEAEQAAIPEQDPDLQFDSNGLGDHHLSDLVQQELRSLEPMHGIERVHDYAGDDKWHRGLRAAWRDRRYLCQ